jgi:hypothetical protein
MSPYRPLLDMKIIGLRKGEIGHYPSLIRHFLVKIFPPAHSLADRYARLFRQSREAKTLELRTHAEGPAFKTG